MKVNKDLVSRSVRVGGPGGQTADYIEHIDLVDQGVIERHMRISVHTDSYPSQAHASIESWDGQRWNQIVWMPGYELKTDMKLGYRLKDLPPSQRGKEFAADRAVLLARAMEVVGSGN